MKLNTTVPLKLNEKYTMRPSMYLPHVVFGYSSVRTK